MPIEYDGENVTYDKPQIWIKYPIMLVSDDGNIQTGFMITIVDYDAQHQALIESFGQGEKFQTREHMLIEYNKL